jgi:hypothetical protein
MGFIFSKIFWGTLLIVWGAVLIIGKIFPRLDIPMGRFIIAFILIYAGVYLLTKVSTPKKCHIKTKINNVENVCSSVSGAEYNIVFGSNVIDLSNRDFTPETININTVFSTSEVYLSPTMVYDIKVNTVFGETLLPDNNSTKTRSDIYTIGDADAEQKQSIEINTVFGTTQVIVKKSD